MTLYPEWGLAEFVAKRASESFEFNFHRKGAEAETTDELTRAYSETS